MFQTWYHLTGIGVIYNLGMAGVGLYISYYLSNAGKLFDLDAISEG